MIPTGRAKIAAVVVLFFAGTFAGQIRHLLDTVGGKVDRGANIIGQVNETVRGVDRQSDDLRAQIADLQTRLASGTATPSQVDQLRALVARLKATAGPAGTPGPAGPQGSTGPPGPPAVVAATSTTTTAPGGTTTTTRAIPATTTTTRAVPSSTTTTTRCTVGLGRLLKIGC